MARQDLSPTSLASAGVRTRTACSTQQIISLYSTDLFAVMELSVCSHMDTVFKTYTKKKNGREINKYGRKLYY